MPATERWLPHRLVLAAALALLALSGCGDQLHLSPTFSGVDYNLAPRVNSGWTNEGGRM